MAKYDFINSASVCFAYNNVVIFRFNEGHVRTIKYKKPELINAIEDFERSFLIIHQIKESVFLQLFADIASFAQRLDPEESWQFHFRYTKLK